MSRLTQLLACAGLGLCLLFMPAPARAQNPNQQGVPEAGAPPAEGESKGDPMYGYVATSFLAGLVLFVVGKSARR